jgi:hypothetical protein
MNVLQRIKLTGSIILRVLLLIPIVIIWCGDYVANRYLDFSDWVDNLMNKYW